MRSSKNRSRNKNNRSRSVGNVVNRVFDSSGPEGKVRGTPQQIIDKYGQLARDATLSNDRVAAENFQQHAEHYLRMLSEAQREQEARREQDQQQQRERQQNQQNNRDQEGGQPQPAPAVAAEGEEQPFDLQGAPQPDVAEVAVEPALEAPIAAEADSGLVETPESKPAPKRRAPRKPKPRKTEAKKDQPTGEAPEAAAE